MNKLTVLVFLAVFATGCASSPPVPPEPNGPLVKVNIQQPHDVYGEPKQ